MDTVIRDMPVRGRELPAFIYNAGPHFTRIRVYEDGMFDCWGMMDRQLFRRKVDRGWVRSSCERGQAFRAHHVGSWEVGDSSWLRSSDQFHDYALDVLQDLNPEMTNLLSFGGEDVRRVDGVRVSWPPGGRPAPVKPARYSVRQRDVRGTRVSALWRIDGETWLVTLRGFPDGVVQVAGLPETVVVHEDGLDELVAAERLVSTVPEGSWLHIHDLGRFQATKCHFSVSAPDIIGELRGDIASLRGGPSPGRACSDAYERWKGTPNAENLETLRAAYLSVPQHLRVYVLGDMDLKDWPIRRALGLVD